MAAAPEILKLLPQPRPDDPPELANALTQAYDLWSRGRRSDAVTMLRGAIVSAAEGGAPDRANDLARQVTELVNALHGPPAPPPKLDRPSGTMAKPPPPPPRARIPAGQSKAPPKAATTDVDVKVDDLFDLVPVSTPSVQPATMRVDTGVRSIVPKPEKPTEKPVDKTTEKPAEKAPEPPIEASPANVDPAPAPAHEVDASWSEVPPKGDDATPVPQAESSRDEPPPTRPGAEESKKTLAPEKKEEDAFGPIDLSKVEVLADVPDDALATLIDRAQRCKLAEDERADAPSMIIVLEGEVEIGVAGRDPAVEVVRAGEARILAPPKPARDPLIVTAVKGPARYLALDARTIDALRASAPWVISELTNGCDVLHSIAGVLAGPLGKGLTQERVAELRSRCESRRLAPKALVIKEGEQVRGLMIVAAGSVVGHANEPPLSAGDVVLGNELVDGKTAPTSFRAGPEGALLLVSRRPQTKTFLDEPEWKKRFRGD